MSSGQKIIDGMQEALTCKPNWTREEVMVELHKVQEKYTKTGKKSYRCDCAISDGDTWCQNCGGDI